jgi:hypothetical protein
MRMIPSSLALCTCPVKMLGSQAPVSCVASWRCCSCCSNSVGPRFPARWRLPPRKGHLDLVKTFVCENAANYVCAWEKGCYGTALTRLNWAQQKEDSFEYFSDGCLVVEDGKVLACGNFDELVQQHAGMTIKVRFNSQRLRARHRMKRATLTIACRLTHRTAGHTSFAPASATRTSTSRRWRCPELPIPMFRRAPAACAS